MMEEKLSILTQIRAINAEKNYHNFGFEEIYRRFYL
jgi:hypothetical protein